MSIVHHFVLLIAIESDSVACITKLLIDSDIGCSMLSVRRDMMKEHVGLKKN